MRKLMIIQFHFSESDVLPIGFENQIRLYLNIVFQLLIRVFTHSKLLSIIFINIEFRHSKLVDTRVIQICLFSWEMGPSEINERLAIEP